MGEKLKPEEGRALVVLPDSLFHLEGRLSHKSYLLSIRKRQSNKSSHIGDKMINSQVKQIIKNFPHYLGDCLIVNNCTESVFNILRIELLLVGQVRYIDLIVDRDTNQFLGLGGTADTTIDFRVSINMCKSYSLAAYMKDAF